MEQNSKGGIWVKASERLPEFIGNYFVKDGDRKKVYSLMDLRNISTFQQNLEWLDESSTPVNSQEEQIKELHQKLAGKIMHEQSLLETNRKLGDEIERIQSNSQEDWKNSPFTIKDIEQWLTEKFGYVAANFGYREVVRAIQMYHDQFITLKNNK